MKEIDLKIKLIDFLIKNSIGDLSLGAEIRFNFGSRRADIVALNNDVATVFEIKSAGDSIDRLSEQLKNYNDYFDFSYVVCVRENIKSIRAIINRYVGIVLVDENFVEVIRKSKQHKRHSKLSLASSLTIQQLKSKLNGNSLSGKSKYQLCVLLAKSYRLDEIRSFARSSLREMISERYDVFIGELGSVITPDDLLTISRMSSGAILKRSNFNSTSHKIVHSYRDPK